MKSIELFSMSMSHEEMERYIRDQARIVDNLLEAALQVAGLTHEPLRAAIEMARYETQHMHWKSVAQILAPKEPEATKQ